MTRMPCLHPGDIQIFNSIFKEELKDYVNVVVFSQKGQRPACNKLSCGDLDGDNYFVTWNQQILDQLDDD